MHKGVLSAPFWDSGHLRVPHMHEEQLGQLLQGLGSETGQCGGPGCFSPQQPPPGATSHGQQWPLSPAPSCSDQQRSPPKSILLWTQRPPEKCSCTFACSQFSGRCLELGVG